MPTLLQIRKKAILLLQQGANDTARLDVDLLLEEALQISPLDLILEPNRKISAAEADHFQAFLNRRLAHEPIAHILGRKEFWRHSFKVSRHCLTPRPDSETLIEAALKVVRDKTAALKIGDFGTGSGCLLLSLMAELPNSLGVGVDISQKALALAKVNAEALGLSAQCQFILSDWAENIPAEVKFDIILCNPPYIAEKDAMDLAPDVRDYEPHQALFAKEAGLREYKKLAKIMPGLLSPSGHVFMEIGHEQGQEVAAIFKEGGAQNVKILQDLAGRDRCVVFNFKRKTPLLKK